ncbi:quinone-oxidoreductase QR1, chloroplastic-like [Lotus japonicus]|uniref:quinone-oxidoreductase QR1, chloroplastic-like n=1 Tax=Lotus japonicus TaxID=34305 RepID=UPI0025878459|nr:quinone-oxidoreductase QR1, chloroplastic-like [Lotus japonicus]XP_057458473.1 quinone-oxidoreductase QR1, chloroplastic-like [Lotus japonicus]
MVHSREESMSNSSSAVKMMHAVHYDAYGGELKHVEVSIPTPKKNEVLLRLEAISINPVDWKIQNGLLRPLIPRKFPYIPCGDVAGEVVEVGSLVKNFRVGDKVIAKLTLKYGGGLAEFAVATERLTVARPSQVSAAEAAGIPVAALTAHDAFTQIAGLKLDGTGTGQHKNILITAASGGVGSYAVQLAKLAGNTHVTATCGARNIDLVKSLGADEVLDYKTPQGATLRSPSGRKYDVVIHCTIGIPWSTFDPVLTKTGVVVDLTPGVATFISSSMKKLFFPKKKLVQFILDIKGEGMEHLAQLVNDGKLKTIIDSKFPLSKAEDAWAKSIDGHATGKIIVEP